MINLPLSATLASEGRNLELELLLDVIVTSIDEEVDLK
jgi:hypothetical protein